MAALKRDTDTLSQLLGGDAQDARAAVYLLGAEGASLALTAAPNPRPARIGGAAAHHMIRMSTEEPEEWWRARLVTAALRTNAVGLLPWMIGLAQDPGLIEARVHVHHADHGRVEEPMLAGVLRTIGYLSRLLLDARQDAGPVGPALATLRTCFTYLPRNADRGLVAGVCTGLGYLGLVEPLLDRLGPREPWMHDAVFNVIRHWMPAGAAGAEARAHAVQFIEERLTAAAVDEATARTLERARALLTTSGEAPASP
jgi:hypothetical protein